MKYRKPYFNLIKVLAVLVFRFLSNWGLLTIIGGGLKTHH